MITPVPVIGAAGLRPLSSVIPVMAIDDWLPGGVPLTHLPSAVAVAPLQTGTSLGHEESSEQGISPLALTEQPAASSAAAARMNLFGVTIITGLPSGRLPRCPTHLKELREKS